MCLVEQRGHLLHFVDEDDFGSSTLGFLGLAGDERGILREVKELVVVEEVDRPRLSSRREARTNEGAFARRAGSEEDRRSPGEVGGLA